MKLDMDCVREVLLFLECEPYVITNSRGNVEFKGVWLPAICQATPKYTKEVIYYTLAKLEEAGLINLSSQFADGEVLSCCVNYITYDGHEFLEKIKPDSVWKKTSSIAGKVGSFSLQMIAKIAEGVATTYVNKLLLD